jgi:hypothetical protein
MNDAWRVVVRWPDEEPTVGPEQIEASARRRFAALKDEGGFVWVELQRRRPVGQAWCVADWAGVKLVDL